MKAIIICAGEATRWGNYLNTKKHLIEIEGEKIVHRTARLFKKYGVDDITIVTKEYDERYNTQYSRQEVVTLNYERNADADKFLSSKHLWNKDGRTIVVYGDCYFTEDAVQKIVAFPKKEWTLFCRPLSSKITGSKYGECFAQSFYPEHQEKHEAKLIEIAKLTKQGKIRRCGGWEHYRAMVGLEITQHKMTTNWELIDDWTDDFDYPEDYDNWIARRPTPLYSIAVMACKERQEWIEPLIQSIGYNVPVAMDSGEKTLWENCKDAWLLYNPKAKWHVVLQDDSILAKNFHQELTDILKDIKNSIVSLYAGERAEQEVYKTVKRKQKGFVYPRILNENALVLPTKHIKKMIEYCDNKNAQNDRHIHFFCKKNKIPVYYPVPSIIEHAGDESIYRTKYEKPEPHTKRRAVYFIDNPNDTIKKLCNINE